MPIIIFHSSIIAQSAREPIAIAARAGGSRTRLHRSFSNAPLPRVVRVRTLVQRWVGRVTKLGVFGILGVPRCTVIMRESYEHSIYYESLQLIQEIGRYRGRAKNECRNR